MHTLVINGETVVPTFVPHVILTSSEDTKNGLKIGLTLFETELRELVANLRDKFPLIFKEVMQATHVSRYDSPDKIAGYDTIVGWVSKNRPDIVENMGTQAWLHTRDGFWLTNQCKKRGLKVHKVRAPEVLVDQGIEEVNAYPVELIAERFDE